jgi:hypothetical protein
VNAVNLIGLIVAGAIAAFVVVAMLFPERF